MTSKEDEFSRFIEFAEEALRISDLSVEGIQHLVKAPPLLEAVIDFQVSQDGRATPSDEERERIRRAKELSQFAGDQIRRGFPTVNAHVVVSLWGALEVLVEDVAVEWVKTRPESLHSSSFKKVKVPIVEYHLLEERDRLRFLVSELRRSAGLGERSGWSRLHRVLGELGLCCELDASTRRDLDEMAQVRHLIVHNAGYIDNRFRAQCPWLSLEVGTRLTITQDDLKRYVDSTFKYATAIIESIKGTKRS